MDDNETLKRLEIIRLDLQSARSAITRAENSVKAFVKEIDPKMED